MQKRADEEYGLISDIRAKLLEIDFSLNRIEAVYAEFPRRSQGSGESQRGAFDRKKAFCRNCPESGKLSGPPWDGSEIVARINLLDPIPANLPKINKLRKMAQSPFVKSVLSATRPSWKRQCAIKDGKFWSGFIRSLNRERRRAADPDRPIWHLKISSVPAKAGNMSCLLTDITCCCGCTEGDRTILSRTASHNSGNSLSRLWRPRGKYFAKVYLVFDGVEDSRDLRANTEIIYTDKTKRSADAAIIERIYCKKGQKGPARYRG